VTVDPHTSDGLKVGRELRDPRVPLICIETALPVKFGATIREALGREAARPSAYDGLESRPQRFTVLPPDTSRVKAFIEEHAAAA
jgi:threonine synthase